MLKDWQINPKLNNAAQQKINNKRDEKINLNKNIGNSYHNTFDSRTYDFGTFNESEFSEKELETQRSHYSDWNSQKNK